MKPIQLPPLSSEQVAELNELYRKTRDPRLRTRAQIILLAAEKQLVAQEIGAIVRLSDQAVRKWLKRYVADSIIHIAAASPKLGADHKANNPSIQPLGSLFEQALGILLDAVVIQLMVDLSIDVELMFARHANLE